MERVEAVRATGIADEIIIEEYEGQKIDDIIKYDVDIFTVGSDWTGYFDYLKEYCKVVYLERTQGVSSTKIRAEKRQIKLGIVGESLLASKVAKECKYVNGLVISGVYTTNEQLEIENKIESFADLLNVSDALYVIIPSFNI